MTPVKAKVLALFINVDSLLVGKAFDKIKKEIYYRPLGGSIEFGEKSIVALRREILEETGNEIKNIEYLGLLENIFTCDGIPGHEILIIFKADFVETKMYDKNEFLNCGAVEEGWTTVCWKNIKDFHNGDILYPDGLLDLLHQHVL